MKNGPNIYPISYVLLDHFVIQFFEENIQLKQIWAEIKAIVRWNGKISPFLSKPQLLIPIIIISCHTLKFESKPLNIIYNLIGSLRSKPQCNYISTTSTVTPNATDQTPHIEFTFGYFFCIVWLSGSFRFIPGSFTFSN